MKYKFLKLILLILPLIVGCGETTINLSNPRNHRSGSISLEFPKTWNVSDEFIDPAVHSFFVKTDGNALVIFQSYPVEEADDFFTFSKSFSDSATETDVGKITAGALAKMPEADGYEWISEDFAVYLLGVAVPHRRLYCSKDIEGRRIFMIFQAATEDFTNAESGFQMIWKSLRSDKT